MSLDSTQLQTFADHIRANTDQAVIDAVASRADNVVATWYSQLASPDFYKYRHVDVNEVEDALNLQNIVDITATNKDRVLALLQIRQRNGYEGSIADTRSAWADALGGAAGTESRAAVEALWTSLATEYEKVFASGGSGVDANNATVIESGIQETPSTSDVSAALNLP